MTTAGTRAPRDPEWYTPAGIPARARPAHRGLGAGAAGKVGVLDLTLARIGATTRIRREYHQAPLHLFRPIHLDPGRPDMAFVFVLQAGDGLVQGDRYRIDIDCEPGSAVHVTTQSATNVFASPQDLSTQLVNLRAGAGAVLEHLPDPVVPFRGSRFVQRTCVTADRSATVILGETLLPGRVAHGEAHVYDLYRAETEVRRPDGALLFADVLHIEPAAGGDPRSAAVLGGYDVVAALYVVTEAMAPAALVALLRDELAACPDILAGVSALPNGCGAGVRLLGPDSRSVKAALRAAWSGVRLVLLGAPAPDLRKG